MPNQVPIAVMVVNTNYIKIEKLNTLKMIFTQFNKN